MAGTKRVVRIAIAALLLLITSALVSGKAYKLIVAYRGVQALKRHLPDLPTISSGRWPHQTEFPVIWLHRVNSVERAVVMAKEFKGMEIDVVYDLASDYFDVGHPPVPSQGISLDSIFSSLPEVRGHYFWIDFKNLTEENKEAACAHLLSISLKYRIVSQIIVESPNPKALACFTMNGFYTSYYLFPGTRLSDMSRGQIVEYYKEVRANLMASKVNAVSSDYRSLPFIDKYLPNEDTLIWYLQPGKHLGYYAALAYFRSNPRVKVILVAQWSPGYR